MEGSADPFSPRDLVLVFADVIAKLGPLTQTVGGAIGFVLTDADGGRWIVDLDVPGGAWSEWPEGLAAATTITTRAEVLASLLFQGKIQDGFDVQGDKHKLWRLSELISAGGSALEQRNKKALGG
ncbi:MAG: hypothetical protein U1E65_15605 [Myxococcota bacterium]